MGRLSLSDPSNSNQSGLKGLLLRAQSGASLSLFDQGNVTLKVLEMYLFYLSNYFDYC